MVTLEEARQIAAAWLDRIGGCTEYTTAYMFFNPTEADGGSNSPVIVLKENGICRSMLEFITTYGGGDFIRTIEF